MISDAYVTVTCDECGADEDIELTALALHNAYDMRNVRPELARLGWAERDGKDICPGCVEDELNT